MNVNNKSNSFRERPTDRHKGTALIISSAGITLSLTSVDVVVENGVVVSVVFSSSHLFGYDESNSVGINSMEMKE